MPRPKPDPDLVALAVSGIRAGSSYRDVAEVAGVSAATVKRWVDAAAQAPAAPAVPADVQARARRLVERTSAPDVDDGPDPLEGVDPNDSLAYARAMRAAAIRNANIARREGNHTAAQRAMRDAAGMAPLIARLERDAREDTGILRLSVAELEQDTLRARERLEAMCERPLLCAKCSRELSAEWGGVDPKELDKLPPA
jgi:hypothetical protein